MRRAHPAVEPTVAESTRAPLPLAALPGPRQWPLLGNLPQVETARIHAALEGWVAEYGPLYRVRLGPRQALVVARADLIAAMLRDRPDGWRRLRSMSTAIEEMGATGVFTAEGDDWRAQRRLVMKAFDPGQLKRYFPSLARVTGRLRSCLDDIADSGGAADLQTLLMRYTVDATAGLAFGIDMNTLRRPDDPLQAHLEPVFPMLMKRIFAPFPWWRYVRLPSDRAFDRHLAAIVDAIDGFIVDARGRMARDPTLREHPTDLLEALIAARDDAGGGLSERALVGNVLTVLLAGEDTTANTLGWTLSLLHRHRDVWDAVVAEVDAVLGDDALPERFDVARGFPLIEDCVNEAMRLHPVAPLTLMQCNDDTEVGGVALRRGTTVMCLMRHDAINVAQADDAAAFRPSRWRDAPSSSSEDPGRALLKASIPFGAGPRLCPGRYLALLEMKMVIAMLARNFELVAVDTADGAAPQERLAFTMFPAGLSIRVRRRAGRDMAPDHRRPERRDDR